MSKAPHPDSYVHLIAFPEIVDAPPSAAAARYIVSPGVWRAAATEFRV